MIPLSGLETSLTKELIRDAIRAGWPAKIAKTLFVTVDKLSISIKYDSKYANQINDLEYGTEEIAPNPIFRTFLNKHSNLIDNKVSEWSLNYLINGDVLP